MAGALIGGHSRRRAGSLAAAASTAALLLGLTASGALASASSPATRQKAVPAAGALPTGTGPGPAATADGQGDLHVFWRDPRGQLWEVQTTGRARKWVAAHEVTGMDHLGSAPAVTYFSNSSTSAFDGLYVFWEQASSREIWYAWQDSRGDWLGPFPFENATVTTSAPAVVVAGVFLEVFWRNASGDLEEATCGGGERCAGGSGQVVTAGGHVMGPMGSAPAVGLRQYGINVYWRGAGAHHLWLAYTMFGRWHRPILVRDQSGHVMGPLASGPAVASGVGGIWWQSAGGNGLEETAVLPKPGPARFDNPGSFSPAHQLALHVRPASAPAAADGANGQYVFWKGRDGFLWFARHHLRWYGPVDLRAGPIA